MKVSRLLILSTLWLSSLSVSAADLIERVQPTIDDVQHNAVEFAVGQNYLLYNVTANAYFTQGSTWSTRGCVAPSKSSAVRIKVVQYLVDNAWDGVTYEIQNYVTNRTSYSWYKACMNDAYDLYLDQTTWENRFYEIKPQGNLTYRLMPSQLNPQVKSDGTQFVGRDEAVAYDPSNDTAGFEDAEERVPLSAMLTEGEGHHIDWQFIDASIFDIYDKAMELKSVIEAAEAEGIDVSAAVSVYNNEDATLAQLQAAIDALQQARANNIAGGTPENPTDATSLLTNPNFDGASSAGWSGTAPNMSGDGNHAAADVAEHYNKTFDTYQDIAGLPAGVYALNAKTFFRGTLADYLANTALEYYPYLYAEVNGDSCKALFNNAYSAMNTESFVDKYGDTTYFGTPNAEGSSQAYSTTYYAPNNPSTFRLYYEEEGKDYYSTALFFEADNTARVGVKKDALQGTTDWAVFDKFELKYYGNEAGSYQKWLELGVPAITLGDDVIYTYSYLQAYNDKKATTVTNKAEVLAVIAELTPLKADLYENISLWQEYGTVINQARQIVNSKQPDGSPTYAETTWFYNCEDALDDYAKAITQMDLTNEELRQIIDQLKIDVEEARKHYRGNDIVADVTNQYLTNADFSANSWEGWTREGNLTGNVAVSNSCGEAWNTASFDIYQEVQNAPAGVYEISVQGFYRYGRGDNAWNNYQNQSVSYVKPGGAPCFVYMNDLATPFKNIFDEAITDNSIFTNSDYNTFTGNDGNTYYAPNNMATAANCFASPSEVFEGQNMFTQKAYGLVVHQGDPMRIGVKGSSNQLGDSWVIFDNFKLTFRGNAANVVSEVLLTEVANAQVVLGEAGKTFMGKTAHQDLQAAIANAQQLAQGTDGDAMFQALLQLMQAETAAKTSTALFDTLIEALNDLDAALMDGVNEDAKPGAGALKEDIGERMESYDIEDDEVPGLISQIREWITKLNIVPGNYSDINPGDFTVAIVNPAYDSGDNKGWSGTSAAVNTEVQNAEIFGGDNGVSYDYYQEIAGLPAGTYQVSVEAFYRYGGDGPAQEFENRYDTSKDLAFLYATTAAGRSSKPLVRLSANPVWYSADDLPSGWAFGNEENNEAVPNTMAAAADYFIDYQSAVTNTIIVKVGDDGKLRIGLVKEEPVAKDWTIFDNWTLTYFGTESVKEVSGDQFQGIDEHVGTAVKAVEFFTIDGRKAVMGQKGIVIMRQTLDNGTIVVKKIRK